MKEALLEKIKRELEEELAFQEAYNEEVRDCKKGLKERAHAIKASGAKPLKMYADRRTKGDILLRLLRGHQREIEYKDTNGIYVYFGTYMPSSDGLEDVRVHYYTEGAEYSIYRNLEIDREVIIPIYERDEFERTHSIVLGEYGNLQKEFIKRAVKSGQKNAAKTISKKYRSIF